MGLVLGTLFGYAIGIASAYGLLATLWVSACGGAACGEGVLRAMSRKRGRVAEAVSGTSVTIGGLAGLTAAGWSLVALGGLVLAVACVVSRVRYL